MISGWKRRQCIDDCCVGLSVCGSGVRDRHRFGLGPLGIQQHRRAHGQEQYVARVSPSLCLLRIFSLSPSTRCSRFVFCAVWDAYQTNPGADNDYAGHGTHVAGTIGGKTVGVAPRACCGCECVLQQLPDAHLLFSLVVLVRQTRTFSRSECLGLMDRAPTAMSSRPSTRWWQITSARTGRA